MEVGLAEGVFTRTAQWNPTLNVTTQWTALIHEHPQHDDGKTILDKRSRDAYLSANWKGLRQQLGQFERENTPSSDEKGGA